MTVAELQKPLDIRLSERSIPKPGQRDVLIKIMAVGICGSDLHYYEHGRIGERVVKEPFIQGHECAGVIVGVGPAVTKFKVGDRVAIEPGIHCGQCEYCKSGRYNLCPKVKFLSTPPVDGSLAQYISHPEDLVYPLPDHLSYEVASLVEPLSVGIHTAKRTGLKPGSTILISGMGPVGLMMILAAKAFGVKRIIVSDVEPLRLQMAARLGAWKTLNVLQDDIRGIVHRVTEQVGVDMVIDTSGAPKALATGIEILKRGGKLAAIGFPSTEHVPLNITLMLQKEIDFHSIYRYTNTYPLGLEILASEPDAETIITNRYPLTNVHEAFEKLRKDKRNTVKVIVHPSN